MELKIIRRNIVTLSNESLKPTRNSPVIFSRLGGRAAYLKRYAYEN